MYTNSGAVGKAEVMAGWVYGLAPWQVIAHHTFVWEAGIFSAQKSYERFMSKNLKQVSYFYALEQNPGRPGYHVHALWADCVGVHRSEIWNRWMNIYGRNRIEPVNSRDDVASYCSKYVTKEGAWWNVKIVSPELFRNVAEKISSRVASVPKNRRASQKTVGVAS